MISRYLGPPHTLHTGGVVGSIPTAPTTRFRQHSAISEHIPLPASAFGHSRGTQMVVEGLSSGRVPAANSTASEPKALPASGGRIGSKSGQWRGPGCVSKHLRIGLLEILRPPKPRSRGFLFVGTPPVLRPGRATAPRAPRARTGRTIHALRGGPAPASALFPDRSTLAKFRPQESWLR